MQKYEDICVCLLHTFTENQYTLFKHFQWVQGIKLKKKEVKNEN